MNSLRPDEPILTLNALAWMTLGVLGVVAGVFGVAVRHYAPKVKG